MEKHKKLNMGKVDHSKVTGIVQGHLDIIGNLMGKEDQASRILLISTSKNQEKSRKSKINS
jgi:hypothetical protein